MDKCEVDVNHFLITLLVGSIGGFIGYKLRIPAGAMLGSMLAVGIYSTLGFQVYMPYQVRLGVQIGVGCLLGLSLNRETLKQLKTLILPALIITVSLLICSLVTGFILYKLCKLDIYTAFLSSSAGGMMEITMLAVTMGADGPKVAVLHLVRMITVVSIIPLLLHIAGKLLQKGNNQKNRLEVL